MNSFSETWTVWPPPPELAGAVLFSAAAFSAGSAPKISTAASIPTKMTSVTQMNVPSRRPGKSGR